MGKSKSFRGDEWAFIIGSGFVAGTATYDLIGGVASVIVCLLFPTLAWLASKSF